MQLVDIFPNAVREIERVWIPLPDGCRLAARVWLPVVAERTPVPAILETGPYRIRDGTRERDERMHRWFAGHGYACVRVDVRGSGDSDGILADEYTPAEQRDTVNAIEWVAAQPWCDGAVGMIGKSWGGFATLQAAAAAPPALRAAIVVCAADDRWSTDAHYMGGCLLVENFTWGASCMMLAAQPAGAISDATMRALWEQRLDALTLLPATWMRHATRDDYWRQGSVNGDWSRIRCPVYAVSGWADAYTDAVPRLLAGLRGARKGLVGPWAHQYPHEATPHPAIGFLQEAKRWWDLHLRGGAGSGAGVVAGGSAGVGAGGGVGAAAAAAALAAEPMYRVWMQEHPRAAAGEQRVAAFPGRWIAEESWPSPRIAMHELALQTAGPRVHRGEQTLGAAAPPWCAFGFEAEPFPDQAADDARSLVLESMPLPARLEILGAAIVEFELEVDRPAAQLAVRLCDVAPNDDAVRVAYTVIDLGLLDDDTHRATLVAGERRRVRIPLRHAAHSFAPGHRVRVAVSTTYWPIMWPSREPVTLHVHAWRLELPVRPPDPRDVGLPAFAPAESAAADPVAESSPSTIVTREEIDPASGGQVVTTCIDVDTAGEPAQWLFTTTGFEAGHGSVEVTRIAPDDPATADVELHHCVVQRWAGDETRVELHLRARGEVDAIVVDAKLQASVNAAPIRVREWHERVARPAPK